MQNVKLKIVNLLRKELDLKDTDFVVDVPDKKITDAHFSSNLVFVLAKKHKREFLDLAKSIEEKLKTKKIFEKVKVENGFLNFWISSSFLRKELKKIIDLNTYYGFKKLKKERIQVEYISANPTGPLTLANGRGGFYGNALSNILEKFGFEVEREYYVNDTGNQILTLGKSVLAHLNFIPFEESFYRGEYIKKWSKENYSKIKKINNNPEKVGELAAKYFLSLIKNFLKKKAKIKFDRYTSEKELHKKGYVLKALEILKKSGYVYKKDDALWLKTTEFGDDKDRVLVTAYQKPTYFLADAGHYLETKERGFKNKIIILGPDHYGYVKRLDAISKIFGFKKSEVLITQAVLVKKNNEFVKMSKRKGEFITFEDLINEVGRDPALFFFLSQSLNSHIDFDIALAKEKSSKNPLYYIEYSYVRALKILKKSKQKPNPASSFNNLEKELILNLSLFPVVLEEVLKNYEIHRLIAYHLNLAKIFHNFYEKERVIGNKKESEKLSLILAYTIISKNIFDLLGITPPKKM
jgi:arginyl-tRNA synthetase